MSSENVGPGVERAVPSGHDIPLMGRTWFRLVCMAITWVLVATLAQVIANPVGAQAETGSSNPSEESEVEDDAELGRPDRVSAMITARALGKPVEVLSERTETISVFARPDGTWATEASTAPTRVQDEQGNWHDLDPTLRETDAGLKPTHALTDLVLSGGDTRTFAYMTREGQTVAWRWPSVLPKPKVEGPTATYVGVAAGGSGDLVVTATRSGFRHDIVLRERPKAPVELVVPMGLDGGRLVESQSTGRLVAFGADGKEVASGAAPVMWDATTTASGDPARIVKVPVEVDSVQATKSAPAAHSMTLLPSDAFLSDPATQYPVTIDPSYTVFPLGDTWMQNNGFTSSQYSSEELRVGTYDGGTHLARSFLKFSSSAYSGQHVLAATLRTRNWYSASCTSKAIRVNRITSTWNSNTVTWGTQPSVTTTDESDFSTAYGSSGCAENYATWDVTNIVDKWAQGTATNYGLRLRGVDESSNATWRKYRSVDYGSGTSWSNPQLIVISNHFPGKATDITLAPVLTYLPIGGSTTELHTSDTTPKFSSLAADADGGTLKLVYEVHDSKTVSGTSLKGECDTGSAPAGITLPCTLGTALATNATYHVRAKAYDGKDWAGGSKTASAGWSDWTTFKLGSQTPNAPTIACASPYTNNSWNSTVPGSAVSCEVRAPSANSGQVGYSGAGWVRVTVDGGTEQKIKITPSTDSNVAKTTITVPNTPGGHKIEATAVSPAGKASTKTTYQFGYGATGISAPVVDPMPVTTDTLEITADGPPRGVSPMPTASFKWRIAGSGLDESTGWNTISGGAISGGTVVDAGAGTSVTAVIDTSQLLTDTAAGITLNPRVPTRLDLQVCLTYTAGTECTWSQQPLSTLRVAHAFGSNYPVEEVAGGQVALWTGELAIGASDATVTATGADLSVSRSAASFAGPALNPDTDVFGPGWSASLDGPDAGLGDMTLLDNTRADGTLVLVDGVGTVMVFGKTLTPTRRTGDDIAPDSWKALDLDTQLSGTTLSVSGSGASTAVAVTEEDGTVTTYTAQTAPTSGAKGVFVVSSIDEAGSEGATTYARDGSGRITRMLAPVPAGVTCPSSGNLPAGCRALVITYATSTTATSGTPGDVAGQVKKIEQIVGASTQVTTMLAEYSYDTSNRLVSVKDPRNNLTTGYSYDGSSDRVASITPPGMKPIQYIYDSASTKLTRVKRERPATDPAGGTATLTTVVYDIPTHDEAGLPDLEATDVAVWDQPVTPTYGAAVFGPDRPFASAGDTVTVAEVAADAGSGAAWADGQLTYTDTEGRVLNTAAKGAGAWQLTSTTYDEHENVVLSLDEDEIAAILTGDLDPSQAGEKTVYNSEVTNGSGEVILPAGSVVTDSYSTARWIRTQAGDLVWARPHTHTDYDQGAPNSGINPATGQRYALGTTETSQAVDPDSGGVVDTYAVTTTDYTNAIAGDTAAGWALGLAATTTKVMAGSAGSTTDIVEQTRYDATGRVIETRQPASNGADAGTRKTYYYTSGTHPTVTACGDQPAWAGSLCQTTHVGTSPTLITTTITDYNGELQPLSTQEKVGSVTRTTTNTYQADGQPTGSTLTTSGLTGSTAIGATTYGYDTATGLQTTTTTAAAGGNAGGTITTTHDTWGRQLTYVPAAGETTTTNYNANGEVSSVVDPQGTTSYTYDGTDAAGLSEHRGLVTKLTITRPSASSIELTGAYDAGETLVLQKLPGGITLRVSYDLGGEPVGLTYSGETPIIDPDTGAVTGTDPDAEWVGWSQENDALGRVRREWTPVGASFIGVTTGASATGFSRDYTYDRAMRLVQVKDQTVPVAGGGIIDPEDPTAGQALTTCEYRDYNFDTNGNRTSLVRTTGNPGEACPTPGGAGAVAKTWAYDNADRITTAPGGASYVYDAFGRVTTLPQADTPAALAGGSPGNVTGAYYDNDLIKTLTQNGTSTSFGLDAAGRRASSTTTPSVGSATTIERHYVDESDNPGWTSTSVGGGAATIERFAEGLDGNLGLTITGTSVSLDVVDLHGDVVSTVDVPGSGNATGIASWMDSDEYGNPVTPASTGTTPTNAAGTSSGLGYGWLGGKQRATDSTGLLLMGVRVYDPVTGQFTSVDPVHGGNSTAYAYPQDPVNMVDLDGQLWGWAKRKVRQGVRWAGRHKADIALTAAGFVPGLGAAALGYRAFKLARGGIYVARTVSGGRYVGQSARVGRRLSQHVRAGKITRFRALTARVYRVDGSKLRREVAEQRMINRLGGIRRLDNKVNPIGKRRQWAMHKYPRNRRGL